MAKKSKSGKSNINTQNPGISANSSALTNLPIPSSGQGWWSQLLTGKDPQFLRADILSPLQNQLVNQAGQSALSQLQNPQSQENYLAPLQQLMQQYQQQGFQGQPLLGQTLGNLQNTNTDFGPLRQQAISNFNQQTIPSLAERFTGAGGQNSSAFQQSLGRAGAGLNENLASAEQQFNMQNRGLNQSLLGQLLSSQLGHQQLGGELAGSYGRLGIAQQGINQGNLQSLLGLGLTPQFQNMYLNPGGSGLLGGLATALGHAGGQLAGTYGGIKLAGL